MEVSIRKSPINSVSSIAMFDYRRVPLMGMMLVHLRRLCFHKFPVADGSVPNVLMPQSPSRIPNDNQSTKVSFIAHMIVRGTGDG